MEGNFASSRDSVRPANTGEPYRQKFNADAPAGGPQYAGITAVPGADAGGSGPAYAQPYSNYGKAGSSSRDREDQEINELHGRQGESAAGPLTTKEASKLHAGVEPADVAQRGYMRYLSRLHNAWQDCPNVTVVYRGLSYRVEAPVIERNRVPSFFAPVFDRIRTLFGGATKQTFTVLAPSCGVIRPGTMTLILAAPGHGKSTFLRALALRLENHRSKEGQVLYNGLSLHEAERRSVHLHRMCSLVGQEDVHFPVLTVKETLDFASDNSVAPLHLLPNADAELTQLHRQRTDLLIELLGLDECADTIIGSDLMRGISGGQRKRVTLGEMLNTNARVHFLDEVTTGLDAAVSFHIFNALRKWCDLSHGSVVTALQQPTPEVYNLFDNLILLRDGCIVYQGPRTGIQHYFDQYLKVPIPPATDEAGFIVDFLSDPFLLLKRMRKGEPPYDPSSLAGTTPGTYRKVPRAQDLQPTVEDPMSLSPQARSSQSVMTPPYTLASSTSQFAASYGAGPSAVRPGKAEMQGDAQEDQPQNPVYPTLNPQQAPLPSQYGSSPAQPRLYPSLVSPSLSAASGASPNPLTTARASSLGTKGPKASQLDQSECCKRTSDMVERYHSSDYYQRLLQEIDDAERDPNSQLDPSRWSPYTRNQFGQRYSHGRPHYIALDMARQAKITFRNRQILISRLAQAVLMGVIYGTLFIQLSPDNFQTRFGLLTYCVMFGAFSNLSELPTASEQRAVVTKQLDAAFYPTFPFILSNVIWSLPKIILESFLFGALMYWIPGLASNGWRFLFFVFVLCLASLAIAAFFRCISFTTPNPDVARQLDFPFIVLFVIFSGFLIPFSEIHNWLVWLYWIDPLSWAVRSIAQNEFFDPRYDSPLVPGGARSGDVYLSQFAIQTGRSWKWLGIAFLGGFFALFVVVSAVALHFVRDSTVKGTRRTKSAKQQQADGSQPQLPPPFYHKSEIVGYENDKIARHPLPPLAQPRLHTVIPVAPSPAPDSFKSPAPALAKPGLARQISEPKLGLPFVPVTLTWRSIAYTVIVKRHGQYEERVLLKDINGFALPGTMTALMGSSGAGKTTLMDVIAGRKTVGVIEGEILVNGRPNDPVLFNKLTGYVEQQDLHMGLTTVREALLFSAKLRLPTNIDSDTREKWVDQVLNLIGLEKIACRLVGDVASPGLSPGQMKLLTIGVELAANPSVLFLDEPTSGLDAPSAYRVMNAVRRIAATGRSVLCTIHQPSKELFFMFDRLLLLRTGGETVFFDDIGKRARKLVDYLSRVSAGKAPPLPKGQNPANWMLDVIGAGVASAEGGNIGSEGFQYADYASIWKQSPNCQRALQQGEQTAQPNPQTDAQLDQVRAQRHATTFTRYWEVQKRYFVMHWRNAPTNLTRFVLLLTLGLMLGLVYVKVATDSFQGLQSRISTIFLGLSFPASISATAAMPSFFRQRAVYYRETSIGMYNYWMYNLAMFVVELPYIFFALVPFMNIYYWMVGLKASADLFFQYFLIVYLMALIYSSLSQLWLAIAPNQIVANIFMGFFLSMFFMFGGLFITRNNMPRGWTWFYYIDPIPKALVAAAAPQFFCDSSISACPIITVGEGAQAQSMLEYDYVTTLINGHASEYGINVVYLLVTLAIIRVLNLIGLRYLSWLKR